MKAILTVLSVLMASASIAISGGMTPSPVSRVVMASEAGAALNTDLMRGGGRDDTLVLQGILDRAKDGRGVHLIVDGPALIAGLDVHSNTTIECRAGGGFFFKDNTVRAILRNAHRTAGDIVDHHITVRGCFINGNGVRQLDGGPQGPIDSYQRPLQEADGTYRSGLQFLGVHYLTIENVTIWNALSYGSLIANAKFVQLRDIVVDGNITPFPEGASVPVIRNWLKQNRIGIEGGSNGGDDGLDFMGPLQYVTIDGVKLRTWDDGLSFMANQDCKDLKREEFREQCTANDFSSPYLKGGAITDVTISNIIFMDSHHGIRLMSADDRVDRIVVSNVSGTIRERFIVISHFLAGLEGNFGSISFNNINVGLAQFPSWAELFPEKSFRTKIDEYERAVSAGRNRRLLSDGLGEEADIPLVSLNARIENLRLQQISTSVVDKNRPIIRVGGDATIQSMTVDLSIIDVMAVAVPMKLLGQIDRLALSLDWPGNTPIQKVGGTVRQLQWERKESGE